MLTKGFTVTVNGPHDKNNERNNISTYYFDNK